MIKSPAAAADAFPVAATNLPSSPSPLRPPDPHTERQTERVRARDRERE